MVILTSQHRNNRRLDDVWLVIIYFILTYNVAILSDLIESKWWGFLEVLKLGSQFLVACGKIFYIGPWPEGFCSFYQTLNVDVICKITVVDVFEVTQEERSKIKAQILLSYHFTCNNFVKPHFFDDVLGWLKSLKHVLIYKFRLYFLPSFKNLNSISKA